MEICYLINQLAPGGAPTLLLDLVRQVDQEEIDFTVAFIEGDNTLARDFERAGANVVSFEADFKFDPRALWRLFRFFRRNSFDIIHAHLPYAQSLGRLGYLLGEHGAMVSTQHNFPNQYHFVTRFTERVTRSIDDITIGVSKAVVDSFNDNSRRQNWRIIYNGIDVQNVKSKLIASNEEEIRNELDISDEFEVVLSVGRYVGAKRHSDIIRALSIINLQNIHLVIVGWGPQRGELARLSESLGVSERVTLTGKQLDVWPFYALANCFVTASENESFGITLVEAMAAELPIVATEVPGAMEVINQAESGVQTVTPGDIDAIANAIERSLSDPPVVDYSNALEVFDIKQISSKHLEVYKEILGET